MNITDNRLVSNIQLEKGIYGNLNVLEMEKASKACVNDPVIFKELERLCLPKETQVVCEPWM